MVPTQLEEQMGATLAMQLRNGWLQMYRLQLQYLQQLELQERLCRAACVNTCSAQVGGSVFHWAVYNAIEKAKISNEKVAAVSDARLATTILPQVSDALAEEDCDSDSRESEAKDAQFERITTLQRQKQEALSEAEAIAHEAQAQKETAYRIVEELLKVYGADINAPNIYNFGDTLDQTKKPTPLCLAMTKDDRDMFVFLLQHDSNPNDPRHAGNGMSLLTQSIRQGKPTFAILLVTNGADVNFAGADGISSPLIHILLDQIYAKGVSSAKRDEYIALLNAMLDRGLNCNVVDFVTRQSAWYRAIVNNDTKVLQSMLEKSQPHVDLAIKQEVCPLNQAVENGNELMVSLLLDYPHSHANPNEGNAFSPLQSAVDRRNLGVAMCLLRHNADPDLHTSLTPKTPFAIAVRQKDPNMMRLLLHYGACDTRFLQPFDFDPGNIDEVGRVLYAWQLVYNVRQTLCGVHNKFSEADSKRQEAECIPESQRSNSGLRRLFDTDYQRLGKESTKSRKEGDDALQTAIAYINEAYKFDADLTEEFLLQLLTGYTPPSHRDEESLFPRNSEAFFRLCEYLVMHREMFKSNCNLRILLDGLYTMCCEERDKSLFEQHKQYSDLASNDYHYSDLLSMRSSCYDFLLRSVGIIVKQITDSVAEDSDSITIHRYYTETFGFVPPAVINPGIAAVQEADAPHTVAAADEACPVQQPTGAAGDDPHLTPEIEAAIAVLNRPLPPIISAMPHLHYNSGQLRRGSGAVTGHEPLNSPSNDTI